MPNPKQYLQKEIIPGNNLSWDTDGVTLNADVPSIEANPQETPTDTLESLELDGTVYGLGGGTEVEANPSDPPTDTLSTIDIAGTVYNIEGGGGGGISYDYYLQDGNIGGGPGSTAYATVPLSKTLTEGVYIAYTIDSNGTTGSSFFTWGGTNITLRTGSITYTLSETAATATDYSGNWRDIFLTIFKLNSGGGTGGGGFSAPDYENPETITLVLNTWVTYNVTENGYIMVDMGGFTGNATTIKVNNTVLSADKSADTGYFLNSTYMFPVMAGDVVELYLNYNSVGYSSNTALFFPAKNGGGGGGGTGNLNAVEMEYEDWLALPQEEKEDPNIEYFLSNAPGGGGGTGDLSAMELTQNQYNNLPTAQKLDDKKLYFINNNITTEEAIDVTDFVNKRETAVTITVDSSTNSLIYAWNGNSDIGAQSVYPTIIPANVARIDYKIITGTSYSTSDNRFKIGIGVRTTYDTTNFIMTNDSGWETIDIYNTQNDVIEGSLDLSEINTDTYLYIIGHGWNMTVEDLTIVTVNESTDPTKIMYKDVEYGNGGSSGSGELVADVIWEGPSTPTTSGTVITLDKSWEDYDFLVFELKQGSNYLSTPMIYLKNIETNVRYIQSGYGYGRFDVVMTLLTSTTMKIERTSSSGVETTYSKIYGLKFNSGGGGSTGGGNLYGTTDPTSDLGNNGDIYMKYQGGSEPIEGETETLTNVYLEIVKGNDWVALPNFDTSLYYSIILNATNVTTTKINISDISTDADNPTVFENSFDDLYGYINDSTLYLKTVIWNSTISSAIVTLNVFQPPQILNTYGKVEDEWVGFPKEGYSETVLWSDGNGLSFNGNNQQTIQLSDNMNNYDALVIEYASSIQRTFGHALCFALVSTIDKTGALAFWGNPDSGGYITAPYSYYVDDTHIRLNMTTATVTDAAYKVIGIKYGNGGGSGSSGGGNLYGTTDPTNDMGSNGDIYMKYANEIINYKFFEGDISDSRYANPMVVDAPNASYYDVFHVTYDYRGFNGTDEVSYSDLEPGEVIFLPSSTDPINGAQIRLADGKFYLYPSTGYTMHVYKIVGESETEVPSKIESVYGKVGNRWLNFPGYSETVLWSGSESISQNASPFSVPNSSYDDISKYDEMQIEYESGNEEAAKRYCVPVEMFKTYPNETVNGEGRDVVGVNRTCYPQYDTTDNCIKVYCETSNPINIKKIIGVKRGESNANSGGVSYSTDEQVVGTWIDGKPVYERVITIEGSYGGYSNLTISELANVKEYMQVSGTGFYLENNIWQPIPIGFSMVLPYNTINILHFNIGSSTFQMKANIVVRYTKTTD